MTGRAALEVLAPPPAPVRRLSWSGWPESQRQMHGHVSAAFARLSALLASDAPATILGKHSEGVRIQVGGLVVGIERMGPLRGTFVKAAVEEPRQAVAELVMPVISLEPRAFDDASAASLTAILADAALSQLAVSDVLQESTRRVRLGLRVRNAMRQQIRRMIAERGITNVWHARAMLRVRFPEAHQIMTLELNEGDIEEIALATADRSDIATFPFDMTAKAKRRREDDGTVFWTIELEKPFEEIVMTDLPSSPIEFARILRDRSLASLREIQG